MSLASPAKQDRVERHLSRQRGAGVRTLESSFGFTFGVAAPETTLPPHTIEPAPKRRKLEDKPPAKEQPSDCRDSEPAPKTVRRAKARRLESIDEDFPVEINAETKEDSFVAVKKATKTRAGPKPRKRQPLPAVSPPEPAEDGAPSRRPRRQAATKAIDKVSQGFVEEAQNVDKLRRGQETVPAKRRRTRKAAETASVEPRNAMAMNDLPHNATRESMTDTPAIFEPEEPKMSLPKRNEKKPKRGPPKREVVTQDATNAEIVDEVGKPDTVRLPLADTTTNPILRSASPEKPSKPVDHEQLQTMQQRSPLRDRSPAKASIKSKPAVAQRKRKPSKFVVSKDSPAPEAETEVVGVGTAMEGDDAPDLARPRSKSTRKRKEVPGPVEVHATSNAEEPGFKERSKVKPSRIGAQTEQQPSVTQVTQISSRARDGESKRHDSKKEGRRGGLSRPEATSAAPAPVEEPPTEENGVDWLLENEHKSKHTLKGRQTRNVKRKPLKRVEELSDDVDLDLLLSNIATFVPRSIPATTDNARHRR
ncbi:hypothetical protein PRZ48_001072 [Zasmidium cellare]|uniref:Uncharacterized protein n=1 Tax=Zasmidium cellare TaxID=395010 RepID=A0ABR0F0T4_ZASCE|nr:hypothetical protein PRZ48_001072 [Zasmidium cellare]